MMSTLRAALAERVVVADGAMGTMLQASDATIDDFSGYEGCNEILQRMSDAGATAAVLLARQSWADSHTSRWIQFALTTPVVSWAGWPFFRRGWRSLVTRHLNMFTLIAMGVGAAFIFSALAMLAPDLFPHT